MSETTVRSQVRYSEKTDNDTPVPLVDLATVKTYFGVTDTNLDGPLAIAIDVVSSVIRGYIGRMLTYGHYTEIFTDVFEPKTERYLIETPVENYRVTNIGSLMNKNTGRVVLTGGSLLTIEYDGGYQEIPADLKAVFMELVRQHMAFMGYEKIGTASPATAPPEKAVWVGTLKVEYAIAANSPMSRASGAGALSEDALAPYAAILDRYISHRKLVAT